jgi:hypothetical protein
MVAEMTCPVSAERLEVDAKLGCNGVIARQRVVLHLHDPGNEQGVLLDETLRNSSSSSGLPSTSSHGKPSRQVEVPLAQPHVELGVQVGGDRLGAAVET